MTTVFTYGSLMCEDIMAAVTDSVLPYEEAVITNFARYAIRGEMFPAIVRQDSARVNGRLYFNVDELGVARLDVFEGDYYQRCAVSVMTSTGCSLEAETYVLRHKYQNLLAAWHWDFDYFLAHGKKEFTAQYLGYQRLS